MRDCARQSSEQQVLGNQLRNDAHAAGADGRPDGDFPLPRAVPCQQEVGDVYASDQHDHSDGAQEHEQRRACRAHDGILHRPQGSAPTLIGLRVQTPELTGDRVEVALSLRHRDTGPQASDHPEHVPEAALQAGGLHRRRIPEIDAGGKVQRRGHDADDGRRQPVDADGASGDIRRSGEGLLPQVVTEYGCLGSVPFLVFAREGPADDRGDPERLEETGADHRAFELTRIPVHAPALGFRSADEKDGELLERAVLIAIITEVRGAYGGLGVAVGRATVTPNETVRVAVGQGIEEHRVHRAEDRGVGSDAERQGEDGGRGEARIGAKLAGGVAEILRDALPARPSPTFAGDLFYQGLAAEFAAGGEAGLVRGLAPVGVVACGHGKVGGDLVIEFAIAAGEPGHGCRDSTAMGVGCLRLR